MAMTNAERCQRWRANNLERALKIARKSWQKWRDNNPESAAAQARANHQRWRVNNLKKARSLKCAASHRRIARKLGNGGSYTPGEWTALKKFYGNRCLCCGKHERTLLKIGRKLVPDHVRSLATGGLNSISNIQPLCHGRAGCNNSKGAKNTDFRKRRLQ
jgi:HNH endonuclease